MIRTDCQSCLQRVLFPCDSVKRLEFQSQTLQFVSQTGEDSVSHQKLSRVSLRANPDLASATRHIRKIQQSWWPQLNLFGSPAGWIQSTCSIRHQRFYPPSRMGPDGAPSSEYTMIGGPEFRKDVVAQPLTLNYWMNSVRVRPSGPQWAHIRLSSGIFWNGDMNYGPERLNKKIPQPSAPMA